MYNEIVKLHEEAPILNSWLVIKAGLMELCTTLLKSLERDCSDLQYEIVLAHVSVKKKIMKYPPRENTLPGRIGT